MKINKSERRFVGLLLMLVGLLYIVLRTLPALEDTNPFVQFVILNLGIFFLVFIVIKAIALDKKHIWKTSLGVVLGFLAIDIIIPEYHVTITGELLKGGVFGMSSTDYVIGYIGQSIGFGGVFLWVWTYLVVFLALIIGAAYLEKNFVKNL